MQAAKEVSLLARYRKDRVFSNTTLFQTFSERLVRKHVLLSQGLPEDHPVLETERNLVRQSEGQVREYLSRAKIGWKLPWSTTKMVVMQYVRHVAAERLREMELDPDVEESVLESVYKEDFESLFPAEWLDS